MAGIAGALSIEAGGRLLDLMLDRIRHRGPDSAERHESGRFAGGVCASRLSGARGSGFAREGDMVVLFDGEIYNDRPAGRSDAEAALEAFKKLGRAFAGTLEGVFACAVWDGRELLLSRDSVGVRPLYRGRTAGGDFVFASEAKALAGLAREVDEVLPGTTFSSESGVAGYLALHPEVEVPVPFEAAARKLRELLTRAVERRLEDGAVGACLLSGGLDSSIIASLAYKLGARVPLVTVGIDGAPDLENAETMARYLGGEHVKLNYSVEDVAEMVPRAVKALESFDEDCVSGAISNLFASGEAAKRTNCILSGEGGDELFGGYHLLKDLPDDGARLEMMGRLIEIAYNTALQRLDRAMMANSINYRTPFIDTEVVAFALQLPVQWKVRPVEGGEPVEKFILREACRDILPEEIYRRRKLRFAAGTGTDDCMDKVAHGKAGSFDSGGRKETPGGYALNSAKELWYYNIFREEFSGSQFERLVGRWDPFK